MACRPLLPPLNLSLSPQRCLASAGCYGLMLLIAFITSVILVESNLQMVVDSGTAAYLGSASQDNTAAVQLAQKGMEIVLADIQSDLTSGITVDSSYTHTSSGSDATMPTDQALRWPLFFRVPIRRVLPTVARVSRSVRIMA